MKYWKKGYPYPLLFEVPLVRNFSIFILHFVQLHFHGIKTLLCKYISKTDHDRIACIFYASSEKTYALSLLQLEGIFIRVFDVTNPAIITNEILVWTDNARWMQS